MMMTNEHRLLLSLVAAAVAAPSSIQLPRTEAETASGKAVTLPDASAGRVAVLIAGFTKTSGDVTERWESRVSQDYGSGRVAVFRVAVLESVPRLLRSLVRGRIERSVSQGKRDSFLLLFHDEGAWKNLVHFAVPDDAYLIVLDGAGTIRWVGHGGPDVSGYGGLKAQLDSLVRHVQNP